MKLSLSKGQEVILDLDDYEFYKNKKLYASNWSNSSIYYAARSYKEEGKWKKILLHREITKAKKGEMVDHINGNTLDNRKENLRLCNNQQNSFNQKTKRIKNKTSEFKGVYKFKYKKTPKPWVARIKVDYKYICLGYFLTELEAAKAYNEAAVKYHGKFAKLNEV